MNNNNKFRFDFNRANYSNNNQIKQVNRKKKRVNKSRSNYLNHSQKMSNPNDSCKLFVSLKPGQGRFEKKTLFSSKVTSYYEAILDVEAYGGRSCVVSAKMQTRHGYKDITVKKRPGRNNLIIPTRDIPNNCIRISVTAKFKIGLFKTKTDKQTVFINV